MGTPYQSDVIAWAREQAALLRSGKLSEIDAQNIAEEIEDVGKSEHRALASHLSVLVAHLLKWKFQASHRGRSWRLTIDAQRDEIAVLLSKAPSLKQAFEDEAWLRVVWKHAIASAQGEIKQDLPKSWIWSVGEVIDDGFWPD